MVETTEEERRIVCVDLDGVLNTYTEWVSPEFFHPPRDGAREFLRELHEAGYRVVILTVRWHEWARAWLEKNDMSDFVDEVTDRKPPAVAYIDDRALCFRGDFAETLESLRKFKPFWDREVPA